MPMEEKFIYTDRERELSEQILESLKKTLGETFYENDLPKLREHLDKIISENSIQRNVFGLNPILCSLQTAFIAVKDIGLNRESVISILLHHHTTCLSHQVKGFLLEHFDRAKSK